MGQFPSSFDLLRLDKSFEKEFKNISDDDFVNYKKAILADGAGFGVAAYAYLRRIFENLIESTFQENKQELFKKKQKN